MNGQHSLPPAKRWWMKDQPGKGLSRNAISKHPEEKLIHHARRAQIVDHLWKGICRPMLSPGALLL